jgi:hypothetical protein
MNTLKLKQGETFLLNGQYLEDDGTPKPLTGVTLKSQIRNGETLVATLDITVLDELAGTYTLFAPQGTQAWPIATLSWDIKNSVGGIDRLTETFSIIVEPAVTQL